MSSAAEQAGASGTRIRLGRRARQWELPIGTRPVTVTRTGSTFAGLFIIVFASIWGGLPAIGLMQHGLPTSDQPENWIFLIFPVIAVGIFLFGLHQLLWRKTITLDDLFVTVEERGAFGTKNWQEQLTAYEGVLYRTRRVSTKNSSYTLYLVDLLHGDAKRTINLYTSRSERGWRAKWEDYARWLKIPAIERTEDGVVARDVADLDKPVAALIHEGKVAVDYAQLLERAEGLAVDVEGEALVVTRTGPELVWWGAIIMVLFPLIFVYVGFFLDQVPWGFGLLFGGMGLLFEAVFLAAVVWDRISRQRLRIDQERVIVNAIGPWGETKGKRMAVAEVEQVRNGRDHGNNTGRVLLITGDRKKLTYGRHLPQDSLDFLVNLVLAKIAKHHVRP